MMRLSPMPHFDANTRQMMNKDLYVEAKRVSHALYMYVSNVAFGKVPINGVCSIPLNSVQKWLPPTNFWELEREGEEGEYGKEIADGGRINMGCEVQLSFPCGCPGGYIDCCCCLY